MTSVRGRLRGVPQLSSTQGLRWPGQLIHHYPRAVNTALRRHIIVYRLFQTPKQCCGGTELHCSYSFHHHSPLSSVKELRGGVCMLSNGPAADAINSCIAESLLQRTSTKHRGQPLRGIGGRLQRTCKVWGSTWVSKIQLSITPQVLKVI